MIKYIKILLILLSISFGYSTHAAPDFLKFPDLTLGQTSPFVKELQKALNNNGFNITTVGAGSLGQESTYFGSLTKKALVNFQNKNNILPATGNLGTKTKAKLNEFLASGKFKSISTGTPVAYGSDTCQSVTDNSITWTFQGSPVCGQFANGDWWVIGPVTITNITPNPSQSTSGIQHGSMINPIPRAKQGFDSNLGASLAGNYLSELGYDPSLNVARSFPLTVQPGSSLVSSKTANTYPNYVRTIAALTVVSTPPSVGSFRPSIYGTDKSIPANRNYSQIVWSVLKSLPAVEGTPTTASINALLPGLPWFEWHEHPNASVILPEDNTATGIIDITRGIPSTYGQEIAQKWGDIALWLNLNNNTQATKEYAMIQTIQAGIDIEGYIRTGGKFSADGGQRAGRKFPLVLAAVALNDQALKNAAAAPLVFQEDQQTFFVCGAADSATCPPGHVNDVGRVLANGHPSYTQAQVGMADWGVKHSTDRTQDNPIFSGTGETHYRHVNWPAMVGAVLAADLMGLKATWNHNAIFAYAERHVGLIGANSIGSTFVRNMWIANKNGGIVNPPANEPDAPTTSTHPAPESFVCGDTIKTYRSTWVNSTESISTPIIAGAGQANPHPANTLATVISGPNLVGGIYWYKVSYQDGLVGYSGGDNFDLVSRSACSLQTNQNTTTTIIPPDITSPIASSVNSTTGSVNLAWDAVPGANAYYVRMREFTDSSRTTQTDLNQRKFSGNTVNPAPFYLYVDGNTSRVITNVDVDPNRYYEFWVNAYNTSAPATYSANATLYFNTAPTVSSTYILSASKPGTGTGSIVGISAASTTLNSGTSITLTAEANPGSTFAGWGGDCSGTGSCVLTMNGNKTITATFTLNAVVSSDEDGDGVVDSNDKCLNTPTNIKNMTNDYGCPKPLVTNLRINNNVTTSDITNISNLEIEDKNGAYGKIKYNQPVNIFGTTDKKSQINLDSFITIANKRVVVDSANAPQLNKPATVTLYGITLAKPLIKKDGIVYATSSSPLMNYDPVARTLTFTVTGFSAYDVIEDTSIYALIASKSGMGSGSIVGVNSSSTMLTEGTMLVLSAEADAGSVFVGWSGACTGTGACSITMNADKSIDASFALAAASGGGGGSVSSGGGGGSPSAAPGAYVNPNNTGLGTKTVVTTVSGAKYIFVKDLKVYARDPEVIQLQKFLNSRGYVVAKKGAGSPGLESAYFGPATKAALARFQKDSKIVPAAGYFGKITKAALNK